MGHTAGALDYLENYGKQTRTKKWVKEQKNRARLAKCVDEITRVLEIIRIGERELEALKSELKRYSWRKDQYFTEIHAEFFQFAKERHFSFKISQQKVPPLDYWQKEQEYWKKVEFLTNTKSQLISLNSLYSQLQKRLLEAQVEMQPFDINRS